MTTVTVPLFDRLPEIYRVRDAEQSPPDQLRAYLAAVELAFGALHDHIAQLYDDLFIDTCDDWVIPYLADLLGTTHLKGEPRTLRADVADTIALRRRKGTLGAVERLAVNLTGWACRAVELRDNLSWAQHLNHQRPDAGGEPPYGDARLIALGHRLTPRGGTAPIRDPAALALLGTPFDNFAYTADVKPGDAREHPADARRINLPNLAVFLWRLAAYRLRLIQPLAKGATDLGPQPAGLARFAVRFDLHPLDLPVALFNTSRPGFLQAGTSGGVVSPLTEADAVPGPMLDARLTTGTEAGHPEAYVAIDFFDDAPVPPAGFDLSDVGLHFFLPLSQQPVFATTNWLFRGDNLCAWETGLRRPLRDGELVIDPDIGRALFGVGNPAQRDALVDAAGTTPRIYASFTYGAVGPVGAHPVSRSLGPVSGTLRRASALPGGASLQSQLVDLDIATQPVVIQIDDSLVHRIDLAAVPGSGVDGGNSLRLAQSLTIRAADGQRPVLLLARPLNFRPVNAADANIATPVVRLEGLYVAPDSASFPAGAALVERAAVARLEIVGCTLSPGGHTQRDGTRAAMQPALRLANGYGFSLPADEAAFVPTPDIVMQRSVSGSIAIDERYRLDLQDCIVDAGQGVNDPFAPPLAIGAVTDPAHAWGAPLDFHGLTVFGGVRVGEVGGSGGIFTQAFAVLDNQHGCIKHSSFARGANRLPPNHFCVFAPDARQAFVSERFNAPAYGQLANHADRRIRTLGPGDDAMGAFGFLLDAHKWANLSLRLAEFMPVGTRPLTVPVT
ncbi:MAG TPA: phage tail protein [Rubrivivax sp.]|nr:phage tail protein [Rubrivivax sp.]